eukprot:TRINITY_DN71_c0_g1_i9.p3 TRINITY_DN71_c0_g1~~TRINITY_DN71_c0_g1_i9.p3  ORF type:complete len:112 (+),score=71.67 TRINITY_DN71_c0_g1_i9:50-337(+)
MSGSEYWRLAGLTYLRYVNLCSFYTRQALKKLPTKSAKEMAERDSIIMAVTDFSKSKMKPREDFPTSFEDIAQPVFKTFPVAPMMEEIKAEEPKQ